VSQNSGTENKKNRKQQHSQSINVATIAQKYGLTSTYETLEGHGKLDH
jgi:hypothetical protein